MAKKEDIDRKELKEPDAFMEGVGSTVKFYEENKTAVFGATAAFVGVLLLGSWLSASAARQLESASAAFLRASDALTSDNLSAAEAALSTVKDVGKEPYDEFASLYQADIALRRGDFEAAEESYQSVAAGGSTSYLRQIGAVGRANALEAAGRDGEAAAAFADAARLEGPYRQTALRSQLRVATAASDDASAIAAIEKILEDFPGVDDAEQLSQQLEELGG